MTPMLRGARWGPEWGAGPGGIPGSLGSWGGGGAGGGRGRGAGAGIALTAEWLCDQRTGRWRPHLLRLRRPPRLPEEEQCILRERSLRWEGPQEGGWPPSSNTRTALHPQACHSCAPARRPGAPVKVPTCQGGRGPSSAPQHGCPETVPRAGGRCAGGRQGEGRGDGRRAGAGTPERPDPMNPIIL